MEINENEILEPEEIADIADVPTEDTSEEVTDTEKAVDEPTETEDSEETAVTSEISTEQERNKLFAEARRIAEHNASVKLEQQLEQRLTKERDNMARLQGFATYDDMAKTIHAQRLENYKKQLEDGDFSAIDGLVNEAANAKMAEFQQREEQRRAEIQHQEAINNKIVADIRELNLKHPNSGITTAEDIVNHPQSEKIMKLIGVGFPLSEAFEMATFNETAKAIQRKTAQSIASKSHMKPQGGGKTSTVDVPENIVASMRKFYPEMSRKEIADLYKLQK